jgi:hypothetical protein
MKSFKFVLIIFSFFFSAFNGRQIDENKFYKAFSAKNEAEIDEMITKLELEKSSSLGSAYLGALYMKKAGFVKGANAKIKTFKKGAALLEDEIAKKPANTEYRFLRLAIQEHAPKILKYNKNLNTDKKAVEAGYKSLDPELKRVIKGYAAGSEVLKMDDLQ